MIKPVFYSALFFCTALFAQEDTTNLVPNGSFEEYNWCPYQTYTMNGFYITACKYWTMPTQGTSDYFNACSTQYDSSLQRYLFSVPENYIGYQYARTGNAYAGLVYTEGNDSTFVGDATYAEYIQVKLQQKLKEGKIYKLIFYVSNADNTYCGNTIGAYFSNEDLQLNTDHVINVTPQYQSDLSVFFCDSTKWFKQEYLFTANGTEQYLIIGVFTKLYESKTANLNGHIISGPGAYGANEYLYIDDVSLRESNLSFPNVFSPNNDGVNDLYKINGISNYYSLSILNRFGERVFETNHPNQEFWNGTYN